MNKPKQKPLPPLGDTLKPAMPALGSIKPPISLDDDAAITAAARSLGSAIGASTRLPAPAPAPRPMVRFSLELPKDLDDQLRIAGLERDTNKTVLIMQGLAAIGFRVDAADLVPGRRRKR